MTQTETAATKSIEQIIATELSVTRNQVWSAIRLLEGGATVPFIARYRKEATGGLSDIHLRMLAERLEELKDLEARRNEILSAIESQGKLNDTLKAALLGAETKIKLEDLYLPFTTRKQTKAQEARDAGLQPLAQAILRDPQQSPEMLAAGYVAPLKGVPDAKAALDGARAILIETFSQDPELAGRLRERLWNSGWLITKKIGRDEEAAAKFSDYFDFREPIRQIPPHRILAILRGRKEAVLELHFATEGFRDYDDSKSEADADYILEIAGHFSFLAKGRPGDRWILETIRHAWKYGLRIRLELDLLMRLKQKGEKEAIKVFVDNLKTLLLAPPAGARTVLGLDPGFRTGVKAAAVDPTGRVLETAVIYPHPPQESLLQAAKIFLELIEKHKVELVAIGNGTASRETDAFIGAQLAHQPNLGAQKVTVSEAGASVYSASALATEELPLLDVTLRGAVSIARRLQDPLAELVKIDPKAIGVGQYQHDVNQNKLAAALQGVVEDCVNSVGVDINTASASLLSYVSGLSKKIAEAIVTHRNAHGPFKNRRQFLDLPEFRPKTFEQAAGFLRIKNGDNPLDASAVHPESYPVVERILSAHQKAIGSVIGDSRFLHSLKARDYADEHFGVPTIEDILAELEKPGRDPRPEFTAPAFKENIRAIGDLKQGMILEGIVTNVTNFGAFVDIGVHQDGLVHISQMSETFVQDPKELVQTGQFVKVKVLEIDAARRRISLSMKIFYSKPSRVRRPD
jgi:uncharacterized protein